MSFVPKHYITIGTVPFEAMRTSFDTLVHGPIYVSALFEFL